MRDENTDSSQGRIIEPLNPKAQAWYDEVFRPAYLKLQEQIENIRLMVLIWGPSSKGGDLYNKRVQILNRLRELGHAAFFSEEIDSENPLQDIPLHIREAHQAQLSDLIVLLHAPYGSAGELHDFVHIPAIRSKLLVFVDEKRVTGYSYQGALTILQKEYNSVVTYKSPEDITECRLLGAVVEKIQLHRHTKYWQGLYSSQGEQKR